MTVNSCSYKEGLEPTSPDVLAALLYVKIALAYCSCNISQLQKFARQPR